ncbi:MAG: type II toxin-antitoxin system RelE/ParE family toxin [Candidatus Binataceae bacterium]
MHVEWTEAALTDLEEHFDYVACDGRRAATRIFTRVIDAVEMLARFPSMGRAGRFGDTRELYVKGTGYIVSYRVRESRVEILRFLHSAQDWAQEL